MFVLLSVLFLSGCACGYLGHVATGQAKLLMHRRAIEKVLKESELSETNRQKILLIKDVKAFSVSRLGLRESKSYSSYVYINGPYVSYALSAAPKDALEPYMWRFPIVGELPYKGFFKKDYALREERKLVDRGFDTYVRGVRAFSTLGYFNDPIVSCMLAYENHDLIETIIHELLHQTIWIKGSVHFNESLANFVGEQGTLDYLALQYGDSSKQYRDYQDLLADTRLFEQYMYDFLARLENLYQQNISREEKIRSRELRLEQAKTDFYTSTVPQMKTTRYKHFFERRVLNNAVFLSFRRYHYDTSYFEKVLAEQGGDLHLMIDSFMKLRREQIPSAFRTENNHR